MTASAASAPARVLSPALSEALDLILKDEGGYAERAMEGGGAVNLGITFTVFAAWRQANGRPKPTFADLKAMTIDEAKEIYAAEFAAKVHFDRLPRGSGSYQNANWSGGPHLVITDREILLGNPLWLRGVHSPSFNATFWGIELAGDFDKEKMPDALRDNAVHAMATLYAMLGHEPTLDTLKFHKDDPRTTREIDDGLSAGLKSGPDALQRALDAFHGIRKPLHGLDQPLAVLDGLRVDGLQVVVEVPDHEAGGDQQQDEEDASGAENAPLQKDVGGFGCGFRPHRSPAFRPCEEPGNRQQDDRAEHEKGPSVFLVADLTCTPAEPAVPIARFCQEVQAPIAYPASTDERVKRRLRDLNARFRNRCGDR